MEKLEDKLDQVLQKVNDSKRSQSEILDRLEKLELSAQEEHDQAETDGHAQLYSGPQHGASLYTARTDTRSGATHANVSRDNTSAAGVNVPAPSTSIQQDFQVIKDAVQRVKLPQDLKVEDSRQGIQRKDQGRFNVGQKCARFAETSVKLLSTVDAESITDQDLKDLCTIQIAQIRYLQEEHSMCLVNNNFGEGVEKIYRNFRRNTGAFPPDAIEALQAAVTLNAAQAPAPTRGSGFRGYRGSGGYRGGTGRGYFSGGRGASPYFSGNNRVQYRPNPNNE